MELWRAVSEVSKKKGLAASEKCCKKVMLFLLFIVFCVVCDVRGVCTAYAPCR